MYTINGIPLAHNVHETLVDDSELYRAQIVTTMMKMLIKV